MAQKLLKIDAEGNIIEFYSKDQSQGATDSGEIVALNQEGKIDPSMLPDEALAEYAYATAGEALNAGDLVCLYNDNGTVKVRKAKANDIDTIADGYVKYDYNDGEQVTVFFEGKLVRNDLTFTEGKVYFTSNNNAGQPQNPAPQGEGIIIQRIGVAIDEHTIAFERQQPIIKPMSDIDAGGANNPSNNSVDGGDAGDDQDTFVDGGNAQG